MVIHEKKGRVAERSSAKTAAFCYDVLFCSWEIEVGFGTKHWVQFEAEVEEGKMNSLSSVPDGKGRD